MATDSTLDLLQLAMQRFGNLSHVEKKIFSLAKKQFQDLLDSEFELFRKIANGECKNYQTGHEEIDNPENAINWGEERKLRGDRIRWLCIEPEVWKLCLPQGIDISGAKIEGSLNLNFATVEVPLRFSKCHFTEALRLQQANLKQLDLSGTYIASSKIQIFSDSEATPTSIFAECMSVAGFVKLNNHFHSKGAISLAAASIGGDLECARGTKLENEGGDALYAECINVRGSIFLRDKFLARGRVSLAAASIGGYFDCTEGKFDNQNVDAADADALFAVSLKVARSIYLNNFQSKGNVHLDGAIVGNNLDYSEGKFIPNRAGNSLKLDNIDIAGSVILINDFKAIGKISFVNAKIGGALTIGTKNFDPPKSKSIDLCNKKTSLDFQFAKVKTLIVNNENDFLISEQLLLNGFVYESLDEMQQNTQSKKNNSEQYLRWLDCQSRPVFYAQPYEQMAALLSSG